MGGASAQLLTIPWRSFRYAVHCLNLVPLGGYRPSSPAGFCATEVLSEQGSLREAAVNLFAALRRLDALGLDYIVARPVPEVELGRAIMDRLRRAAAQ